MSETLFFALQPDAAIAKINEVAMGLGRGLPARLISNADRLHVTLHFIGNAAEFSQARLDKAYEAASIVKLPAFDVSFDKALSFQNADKRPLVLASNSFMPDLRMFHIQLGDELGRRGIKPKKVSFTPHITLSYEAYVLEEQLLAAPVKWTAREFVLIKSFVGQGRYEILRRWPLHDA